MKRLPVQAWNKVFFGLQCTGRGAAVISFFFALLLASTYLFYTVDPIAGYYMLPTCCWVAVATALNWNIYLSN
jgi:tryptophan-rich sensory protein